MDAATGTARRGSRFGSLVRGLLLGAVVSVIGMIALSLWMPPPADMPMPGRVEVLGTPPAAEQAPSPAAEQAPEQAPSPAGEPTPAPAPSPAAEQAPPAALPAAPEPLPSGESSVAEQQTGEPAAEGEPAAQAPAGEQPETGQPPVTGEPPAEHAATENATTDTERAAPPGAAAAAPAPAAREQSPAPEQPADEQPAAEQLAPEKPAAEQTAPQQPAPERLADQPGTGAAAIPGIDDTSPPDGIGTGTGTGIGTSTGSGIDTGSGASIGTGTGTGGAAAPEAGTQTATGAPPSAGPQVGSQEAGETSAQPIDAPALEANARAYQAPPEAPLMAVVLVAGTENAITPERLSLLTMPLTVAIRPDVPGSAELGAAARAAGHEVLADLSLAGTPPGELAERTKQAMATLDMAVGATAAGGAADAARLAPVLDELHEGGFAWVDTGAGIGTPAERIARQGGVAYTQSNKSVPPGTAEGRIYDAIRAAAYQARQWGTSVLILPGDDATLKELVHWGLENDRRPVWFAPISAVIRKRAD